MDNRRKYFSCTTIIILLVCWDNDKPHGTIQS